MNINWKDVVGYEGYYQVSDTGLVRSLDREVPYRNGVPRLWRGRILKPALDICGYLKVNLSKLDVQTTKKVHQLVAEAFIGPRPEGQEVRHGSNGPLDNSVDNLCYGTRSQNQLDRRRDRTHNGRPVRRSGGKVFASMAIAAKASGCQRNHIWSVCNGRRKSTGGFGWEYLENST